jgi:hypothetical protein
MGGIPTDHDRRLAHLQQEAAGLLSMLTSMHFANTKDHPRMRSRIRERLVDFANDVMNCADKSGT